MTNGWQYLEFLETARPSEELDTEAVVAACDKLTELNRDLRCHIEDVLRDKGFNKWADGLRNEFLASDERLFNCYFGNKAYSFKVPSQPPDHLDGRRTAILFHMSDALQQTVIRHLRALPEAVVMDASSSTEPDEFTRVYRFTNMRALVNAIKSVQRDVEDFALRAKDLLVGTDGPRGSFRSASWPHDADVMAEQVLLGFTRSSAPSLLNSTYLSSPIVAAGLVRSHLEAVLFRIDFTASLEGQEPLNADAWDAALKLYRDAGHVTPALSQWVTELYGLLSSTLHSGATLSRGEVWAFRRVVDLLRNSLPTVNR